LLDDQVTTRSVTITPRVFLTVAVSAAVPPTTRSLLVGCTATLATGARTTVTVTASLLPSLSAVTCALPGATAVMTPAAETVST
jgi:hypothetical protein